MAERRMKDRFLRESGGFRSFEDDDEFLERQRHIIKLRRKINRGDATLQEIDQLSELLRRDSPLDKD